MHSHLLMTHLASTHLGPDGYILYNSDLASYNPDLVPTANRKQSVIDFVKNATIAKQGSDLAEFRTEEEIVWINNVVNVLMSEQLITEKQKKSKKELKRYDNTLKSQANLLKYWCTGDGRPENGSYVGFDSSTLRSGKVSLPKYF